MHSLNPTNKITLIAWIPIWLIASAIIMDYVLLDKVVFDTRVGHIKESALVRGNQICKLTLSVPSKYKHPVFNTKLVDNKICQKISTGQNLTVKQSLLFDRWLLIKSNEEEFHYEDNKINLDIIYIVFSIILPISLYKYNKNSIIVMPRLFFSLYAIWCSSYIYEIFN